MNVKTVAYLTRKFELTEGDVNTLIEVLKQKVIAISHKIHRYDNHYLQYCQNQVFWIDSKQVLHPKATVTDVPEPVAPLEFWKALWGRLLYIMVM